MREAPVEDYLRREVKRQLRGIAVKLNPFGVVGIPDRLVLGPGRLFTFVELKRPRGGVVSGKQERWHTRLRDWGFEVEVLSSKEAVDDWIKSKRPLGD